MILGALEVQVLLQRALGVNSSGNATFNCPARCITHIQSSYSLSIIPDRSLYSRYKLTGFLTRGLLQSVETSVSSQAVPQAQTRDSYIHRAQGMVLYPFLRPKYIAWKYNTVRNSPEPLAQRPFWKATLTNS